MTQVVIVFKKMGQITYKETIELEPGQVFKKGFASDPKVINRDGTIARQFDWATSLTHDNSIDYQYFYEIQEIA